MPQLRHMRRLRLPLQPLRVPIPNARSDSANIVPLPRRLPCATRLLGTRGTQPRGIKQVGAPQAWVRLRVARPSLSGSRRGSLRGSMVAGKRQGATGSISPQGGALPGSGTTRSRAEGGWSAGS